MKREPTVKTRINHAKMERDAKRSRLIAVNIDTIANLDLNAQKEQINANLTT